MVLAKNVQRLALPVLLTNQHVPLVHPVIFMVLLACPLVLQDM